MLLDSDRTRLFHWQTAEAELPTLIKKIEPLLTGGENT
jgi:hypothetical protein